MQALMHPMVSVVTPFYNTEDYLEQAIQSVLAQTYEHFEYILSDNCSTDASLSIAQRYAAIDPRIRLVVHTEFIAQDPNYNRALRCISPDSQYTKVVQADDRIHPNCLADMVALAEPHPNVAIVGCCYLAGNELAGDGLPFDRSVFSGKEACRTRLLQGGTYFASPTCLLYRSSVVRRREPFYGPNQINADTAACFEILMDADFARVPQILAYLRRDDASISSRFHRFGANNFVNLALVEKYGPHYLSPAELVARRKTLESSYLRALARAAVRFSGRDYWEFHASMLASLGRKLPWFRVGAHACDLVLSKVLNPRQTIESALSTWRRR